MILDCKKTLLKIWFNPGLNIWTTARSEFLCRDSDQPRPQGFSLKKIVEGKALGTRLDSDYVSTSYDKRTVWMTPGGGLPGYERGGDAHQKFWI